jgi:hypothetical protein
VIVELALDPHGDQDLIDGATLMTLHLLSPGGGGWDRA